MIKFIVTFTDGSQETFIGHDQATQTENRVIFSTEKGRVIVSLWDVRTIEEVNL